MIVGEPAPSAANAQRSAFKEPVTIQSPNIQWFLLTVQLRPRNQGSFRSAATKITCEEVTHCSDEDEDAIIIASSKVEEQFNAVK